MAKIRTELKWAIIFIAVLLTWMLIEKLTGLHDQHIQLHPYLTMLFMIPAIWIYILALRDKKRNDLNGQMSFKQGFISGLIITLIVTILSPINQYIISNFITPDFFKNAIDYSVKQGMQTQKEAESYFNLQNYMIQSVIGALISGILTSAIVAYFVKTKKINN